MEVMYSLTGKWMSENIAESGRSPRAGNTACWTGLGCPSSGQSTVGGQLPRERKRKVLGYEHPVPSSKPIRQ